MAAPIDNLEYGVSPTGIPKPGTLLMLAGAGALALLRRARVRWGRRSF